MKPLVYVAGPYTTPDPVENTHHTAKLATELVEEGLVVPVIPHITLLWHIITPRPYQFWLDYDIEVMLRCDAVLRLPGASSGADGEVQCALANCIPVFYSRAELYEWVSARV